MMIFRKHSESKYLLREKKLFLQCIPETIIFTDSLLKTKSILILDEVFNEISIDEEKEILNNIFNEYKDKIIIMISHRNSNIELFDKKYKFKKEGDLVEIK